MEKMYVKLAVAGMVLRDPVTKMLLTEAGKLVPKNSFWLRRVAAGEVVVVENPGNEKSKSSDKKDQEQISKKGV